MLSNPFIFKNYDFGRGRVFVSFIVQRLTILSSLRPKRKLFQHIAKQADSR